LNPLDYTIRMPALAPRRDLDTRSMKAIPALIDALDRPLGTPAVEVPKAPAPPDPNKDPLSVLVGALKSKNEKDRVQAARELGGIGADAGRAIPVLLEVLRDGEVKVRTEAARALERMGPLAQAALSASLRDQDPVVRRIAAEALARILRRKRDRTD
jgi:hypothetical protein